MSRSNDIAGLTTSILDGVTKAEVGLGNVDNTADSAKPVSTAQQSAIDLKANIASPTFTGTTNVSSGVTLPSNPTITLGSNATFPAGHIINTSKDASMSRSGHISTTSSDLEASGIIVSSPATSGSNFNLITLSTATYMNTDSEMSVHCYVSYNGGGYAILGTSTSSYGPKHGTFTTNGHRSFCYTWIDNSGSTSSGTNLYQIYFNEANTTNTAYLTHSSAPYLFMVQEVQV